LHSIEQTSDGGYIVAGETTSFGNGKHDGWILKVDAQGDMEASCSELINETSAVGVNVNESFIVSTSIIPISINFAPISTNETITNTSFEEQTQCPVPNGE